MIEKESFKINKKLLNQVRELKKNDRGSITWHIERAISNYLKVKLYTRLDYINKIKT